MAVADPLSLNGAAHIRASPQAILLTGLSYGSRWWRDTTSRNSGDLHRIIKEKDPFCRSGQRDPEEPAAAIHSSRPWDCLAIETSCDDTCAAVLDGPRVFVQRDLLAGRGARPASAAWCRRSPRATTSSWPTPVVEDGAGRGGCRRSTTIEAVAVTAGPGLIGALLVGGQHAPRRSRRRGGCR